MALNNPPLALVIDDQDDIREVIKLTLVCEGWRVNEAVNGRDGLELVSAKEPDLIVVDLMMPEMNGIEFCRHLSADLRIKSTPVLLVSGANPEAEVLKDFWDLPLRHKDFLHKPFNGPEFLRCIQGMMPRIRSGSAAPIKMEVAPKEARQQSASPPLQPAVKSAINPKSSDSGPPPPPAGLDAHRTGYRILIVDDDIDIRSILQMTLGFYHTVETAANGVEGLEQLEKFTPDFIICDINMPVLNGLETVEAIRRHPVFLRIPVFFLTGETDASLPRKAFEIGANLYLRKPLDPMRLLKNIDYFLEQADLKPGAYLAKQEQIAAKAKTAAAKTTQTDMASTESGPLRLLIVDFNIENQEKIKRIFEGANRDAKVQGGPFEILATEDPYQAVGNLTRWQPDLILYNPRNPRLDGLGFGQTLSLQKAAGQQELAFIGTRFFDVDEEYSRRHFNRGVIELDTSDETITTKLSEAAAAARQRFRKKQFTLEQIHAEEVERLRKLNATSARQTRERESMRQRFNNIQEFIDKQFID